MALDPEKLSYFNRGDWDIPKFWGRLGGEPSFSGKKVLEVGCGFGALCISIARADAKKVVAVDINESSIKFAKENLRINHKDVLDRIEFKCIDIARLPDSNFDFIISKNSFEHIIELETVFNEMKKRLKPGGIMYIGFSPLYNSPYGDHRYTRAVIPWGHVFFSEKFLVKRANKVRKDKISSIYGLGLNKWKFADYKKLFYESGLKVSYFKPNNSSRTIARIFSVFRHIKLLEEYFTFNLYCILEKRND